ncbi:hypothetical protein [Olegusella massiliensis]|uniref:hypothetical protein n=1 Tax=Olegusella massiliensis TaxID=1776381 RepID=UPI0003ADB65C|nr:hypothetical protein [Olegusella massiliensis]ERL12877.1 hypothetical protein HMPREF1248_1270 [Coriobacteriaceae bacterium BV3Ac1]MBS5866187.1 hypothetical protein [Coriobacteriaceae bacterium]
MSLRDTLAGAREEAALNGNPFAKSATDTTADQQEDNSAAKKSSFGQYKSSAARAKPSREAAAAVRVVSSEDYKLGKTGKAQSEMTKEEQKAERRRQRNIADARTRVARSILNGHASYKRSQHIWWVLLGGGMGMTVLSLVLGRFFPAEKSSFGATLSVITLVAAYALIIAGFVFDWRSVRPMRNAADAEVARMSDKRILQYAATHLDEDAPKKSTRDKKDKGTK